MRGQPIIVSKRKIAGHIVEKHLYSDRLGFLPEHFFVCRGAGPFDIGTGDTPQQAIARLEASHAH